MTHARDALQAEPQRLEKGNDLDEGASTGLVHDGADGEMGNDGRLVLGNEAQACFGDRDAIAATVVGKVSLRVCAEGVRIAAHDGVPTVRHRPHWFVCFVVLNILGRGCLSESGVRFLIGSRHGKDEMGKKSTDPIAAQHGRPPAWVLGLLQVHLLHVRL